MGKSAAPDQIWSRDFQGSREQFIYEQCNGNFPFIGNLTGVAFADFVLGMRTAPPVYLIRK